MKTIILILLVSFGAVAQTVPDTDTFTLQDVVDAVTPTTDDLTDCFADASAGLFDPAYAIGGQALSEFRNYDGTFLNRALDFQTSDDAVSFTSFNFSSSSTMSFWIYPTSASYSSNRWLFDTGSTTLAIRLVGGLSDHYNISLGGHLNSQFGWVDSIIVNVPIHIMLTRSGTTVRAYKNGIEADLTGSASPQTSDNTDAFNINKISAPRFVGDDYEGEMNELAVWIGTVGTLANAVSLYNSGDGVDAASVISSPDRYYKFNETGSETTVTDTGSDAEDGFLNSFPTSGMWVQFSQ